MPTEPFKTRKSETRGAKDFDLIVIGAGINGAGIARDAAMRGLSVLLVDKGDIGGGTSSWSTRLIHGGLRYLEHAEFGLVRESLREREILFRLAPHLVKPLPMLIPLYRGARRSPWTIRAGMIAYDLLSTGKSLPGHRMLSHAEALDQAPGLEPKGLLGAAVYNDAQVEFAERLVLENALSAQHHGASVRTYTRVEQFVIEDDRVVGVELTNLISGERYSARGRITINAAGPWVDEILGASSGVRLIGGTKGSHLVVGRFPGAPQTALYVEAGADSRPFFIIPWNGNFLIGTTDKRFEGSPDGAAIDEAEIEYLLGETNRVIPGAKLTRESILFSYSGVRPLPFTSNKHEQSITRRHFIHSHGKPRNLFSIIGGKLTTYRSLSEEAVDLVVRTMGRKAPRCRSKDEPLPGGAMLDLGGLPDELVNRGLSAATIDHLSRVYGMRAGEVMKLADDDPTLLEIFDSETGAIGAEVVFAFKHELAQTLRDCLLRRTMVGLNSTNGKDAVHAAAHIAQRHLDWSTERVKDEIENFLASGVRQAASLSRLLMEATLPRKTAG
jgi:glycerol-3-phosphate dehydrogenase